jgi:hypothetical protein
MRAAGESVAGTVRPHRLRCPLSISTMLDNHCYVNQEKNSPPFQEQLDRGGGRCHRLKAPVTPSLDPSAAGTAIPT